MKPRLTAINLSIGYRQSRGQQHTVAERLDFDVRPGELTCLVGSNGVGKSTLLRTLAGLQPGLSGSVHLDDRPVNAYSSLERARRLSMVLSHRGEIGHIPARSLVGLGRHPYTGLLGGMGDEDHKKVDWAIAAVAAEDLANRYVDELSDGERQKILVARALAQDPDILLLDEPTSHLDLPHSFEILQHLRRFAWGSERAVLMTTHDIDQALRMADRVWLFLPNGRLVSGAPEDLVLSGKIHEVFPDKHVSFDMNVGRFVPRTQPLATVNLTGAGDLVRWTETALRRSGIIVADEDCPLSVSCMEDDGDVSWRIYGGGVEETATSVYELMTLVRQQPFFNDALKESSNGTTK